MEYNKIIAVTGLPGLYELLSSKTDGAIVRSLDDKSTRFVSSRIHNFSHLESIEVYTVRDNANLVDVLKAMEASTEKLPDEKDNSSLKGYFSKVFPDLDFDRVYSSDLKKMVKWFSVLKSNNIEIKLSEPEEEVEEVEAVEVESNVLAGAETAAPKKKAAPVSKETEAPKKGTAREPVKETAKAVTAKAAPKQKEAAEEKPKPKKAAAKAADEPKTAAKKKAEKAEEKPKKAAKKKS
jgi:hypothetical protein